MILVSVGYKITAQLVYVFFYICRIGYYKVNARHTFVGKSETCVNNYHVVFVFDDGHVFSYFSETSERYDLNLCHVLLFIAF